MLDNPVGDFDAGGARTEIDACLGERSSDAQVALTLRFAERQDRASIAARRGLGENGIESLLKRTYARLRVCIERRVRDG